MLLPVLYNAVGSLKDLDRMLIRTVDTTIVHTDNTTIVEFKFKAVLIFR